MHKEVNNMKMTDNTQSGKQCMKMADRTQEVDIHRMEGMEKTGRTPEMALHGGQDLHGGQVKRKKWMN